MAKAVGRGRYEGAFFLLQDLCKSFTINLVVISFTILVIWERLGSGLVTTPHSLFRDAVFAPPFFNPEPSACVVRMEASSREVCLFLIYPIALFGCLVEGEFTLLAICLFLNAQATTPPLVPLAAMAAIGAFFGDWTCFELGRRHGNQLTQRWPRIQIILNTVGGFIKGAPVIALPILRFQIACRMVGNLSLGMGNLDRSRYLIFNGVACIAWAAVIVPLCFYFTQFMVSLFGSLGSF